MKNNLLKKAREELGWTQHHLADEMNVEEQTVRSWERGIRSPGLEARVRLANVLDKSLAELGLSEEGLTPPPTHQRAGPLGLYDPTIPPRGFPIGRDALFQIVKEQLQLSHSHIRYSLYGLPGVGKTMLACMIAQDANIRDTFCDGILWAGLGPTPNIAGLLSRWGTLLGISSEQMTNLNSETWAITLCTAIGRCKMLLIIDDAWDLEDAQSFQVGGPNCAYVMTTRSPDIAFQFAANVMKVEELNDDESMHLLAHLAPEVTKREPADARALIQSVGGLPLALTLIGRYLHLQEHSGPRRMHNALQRLQHVEDRLRLTQSVAPLERTPSMPSSISLQATIEVSEQQLSSQGREALRRLAVFPAKPNTFSEEAAIAISGVSVDVLDELSDAGLLERRRPDRYCLHQTISDYAHAYLRDTEAYDRLIAFMQQLIEHHAKDYELLSQESDNVCAALDAAYVMERKAELVHAVYGFAPFLMLRGSYNLAEQHLKRANEASIMLGDDARVHILLCLGQIAQKQGHYVQAEVEFQKGLLLARKLDDPSIVDLLADLGWVTWKQGNYSQAETYLQEGLSLAHITDDKEQLSNILKVLGSVRAAFGDYKTSTTYLMEGLVYARQTGDRGRICVLLINLGVTVIWQTDYAQGERYLQEGLALAREIGHYEWISLALLNLSGASLTLHHYKDAQNLAQEGLELARQINQREWISSHLINLGIVAREEEKYSQAEMYLQEGLTLMQQIGRPSTIAEALYEYGALHLAIKQTETAETMFRQMKEITPEGDQQLIALWQYGMARLANLQGNSVEAYRLALLAVSTLDDLGSFRKHEVNEWLANFSNNH